MDQGIQSITGFLFNHPSLFGLTFDTILSNNIMKTAKQLITIAVCLAGIFWAAGCSTPKEFVQLGPADVSNLMSGKSFIFIAQRMNPMSGPQKPLTSYYDVVVSKDTVNSFLPYFGRSYVGIINTSESPLQFISTNFSYKVSEGKNGWEVAIAPNDRREIQSLNFTVFNNGSATLNVTSTNREAISFSGYVQPRSANK